MASSLFLSPFCYLYFLCMFYVTYIFISSNSYFIQYFPLTTKIFNFYSLFTFYAVILHMQSYINCKIFGNNSFSLKCSHAINHFFNMFTLKPKQYLTVFIIKFKTKPVFLFILHYKLKYIKISFKI